MKSDFAIDTASMLILTLITSHITGKLKFRGITEVRGALQRYHGNNT